MLKKFCICLLAATVAFLSTTVPTSVAFNATATTLPPVVLMNENVPAPTPTTVSVNLSFAIRPEAMDLIKTVSISSHEVYGNYLVPLTMDLSEAVSVKCVELYEKFQTLAKDRFDTISAKIYEKAMDLMKTVSTSCHGLYKNYLAPLVMDLFDVLSAKCEELYEKYEPLAKDRFNTISTGIYEKISSAIHPEVADRITTVAANCQRLYKKYQPLALEVFDTVSTNCHGSYKKYVPLAMDRITTIATNCHGFYKKYQPLALKVFDTVSTNCHGFYKKYVPLAMDLLDKMLTKSHGIYKKHLVPLATNLIATGSVKCQEFYTKYLPLAMDCFHTILTQIYEKSILNQHSNVFSSTKIALDLVNFINDDVSDDGVIIGNIDGDSKKNVVSEIVVSMMGHHLLVAFPARVGNDNNNSTGAVDTATKKTTKNVTSSSFTFDSKNKNTTTTTLDFKNNGMTPLQQSNDDLTSCHVQTMEMVSNITSSLSRKESNNKKNNTAFAFYSTNGKSNETSAMATNNNNNNTTASLHSKWYMVVFHENSTPTFMTETITSDSLLDDFASLPSVAFNLTKDFFVEAVCDEWQVFYEEYESFLPSSRTTLDSILQSTTKSAIGTIRTHLGFVVEELAANLEAPPNSMIDVGV